jgi:hypothetical protein
LIRLFTFLTVSAVFFFFFAAVVWCDAAYPVPPSATNSAIRAMTVAGEGGRRRAIVPTRYGDA